MKRRKFVSDTYVSDFETTTDDPEHVQVWSAHSIKVGKDTPCDHEHCVHQTNIADFITWVDYETRKRDITILFHNLKFDGSYIIDYLSKSDKWHLFDYYEGDEELLKDHEDEAGTRYMQSHFYTYSISDKNIMYSITLKCGYHFCTIRDSMKLLPFSLRKIAKDFKTPHQKLEMEYGHKYPGYNPTPEEMAYIDNDVFVLKEAIEIFMQLTGHDKDGEIPFSISSECLHEFKTIFKMEHFGDWKGYFPSQYEYLTGEADNFITFDDYIRRSYKGGWCYVRPDYKGQLIDQAGFVDDVNSLYPSVMHSQSGSFYPYGEGIYAEGGLSEAEKRAFKQKRMYYFLHIRCEFQLKPGHVPCIQIKRDFRYLSTEWLSTSDVINRATGERSRNIVDLWLSCVDFKLFLDQYEVKNLEIVSHISYSAFSGIFDTYINKWYSIKQTSKGAKRATAKLFLNSCYGKFAQAPDGSYIILNPDDDGVLRSTVVKKVDPSRAIYIPIGAAITSWARNFTIRHAQANYNIFRYSDTDSLHMVGKQQDAVDIIVHQTNLGDWKCESGWDKAIFAGQKRYIEHVVEEDQAPVKSYHNIKCCGLGGQAKKNLNDWLESGYVDYTDFKPGLVVPGNLKGRRVNGGIFLQEKDFCFR